jgi:hypothetical protein
MHTCSIGQERIDTNPKGDKIPSGVPKEGEGKCTSFQKQGEQYCPSDCYNCKERDELLPSQTCKQGVEESKEIGGKTFYLGRPSVKVCPKFDPEITEVIE